MFKKLFGGKKEEEKKKEKEKDKKLQRAQTVDNSQLSRPSGEEKKKNKNGSAAGAGATSEERKSKPKPAASSAGDTKKRRKKAKKVVVSDSVLEIDVNEPIEYPCTPETILEYHRQKPYLTSNEEWLVVELNEYECLVDGEDMVKIIAKHSKFFELDPPELWEEFFEFVEDVPSYDEVINYDVWQEFRDKCYPC